MRRMVALLVNVVLILGLLSGCGSITHDSNKEVATDLDNIIVLAGNHSNSIKPNYSFLKDTLENVAYRYGDICLIVNDGDPFIACNINVPEQKRGISSNKRKAIAVSQAEQVLEVLNSQECIARTEGLDILSSYDIVSRVLRSEEYIDESTIVYVFDTGLSTIGLDFTELDLSVNTTEEIVDMLEKERMIPDLTNVDVVWFGLCDVDEPQAELSKEQQDRVKDIWTGILTAAGANVQFMSDISTDRFDFNLPYIQPVLSRTSAIEWNNLGIDEEKVFPEAVVFDESSIAFTAGTADLVDYNAAYSSLQHSAEYIKENKDFSVLLVGSTARWGDLESYCVPLSTERCETVKKILVDLGVEEKRILVLGMGYENPFYQNDHNKDGTLNEELAQKNRCIVMLDANGELGKQLLTATN